MTSPFDTWYIFTPLLSHEAAQVMKIEDVVLTPSQETLKWSRFSDSSLTAAGSDRTAACRQSPPGAP